MSDEQIKIIDQLAGAKSDESLEKLLDALIDDATFNDVAEMKALLFDRLAWEKKPEEKYNYWKALEFLD
ncbi:MAG: hypothetical protein ACXVPN_00625 [Bacteroidia bacterium]